MNRINEIIKFTAYVNGKQKLWYIDTSNMTLTNLLLLRKELEVDARHRKIDSIINSRIGIDNINDTCYEEVKIAEQYKNRRRKKSNNHKLRGEKNGKY